MNAKDAAYDRYVTIERPGSWNRGYNAGFYGEPFDDEDEPSEQAYHEGYDQGRKEAE